MKTKQITIGAVLIAINIVLSYVAKLPTPTGFVSLVETGIFIGAWHFGPKMGLAVGGLTGFLLDLFAGYPQWMLFSLLIHGGEGWVIGHYNVDKTVGIRVLGNILGGITMVVGYWLAGSFLLWVTGGSKMSLQAATLAGLTDVPANIFQVLVGFILALIVSVPLRKWIR
ncbi:ECF transporter S component [Weissella fangxianensis]|uniref:Integral membrane protein n=1 Tax=Weissella thailandensis fsh4-2 TaxID=1056112 RepID=G0UII6_9LACO|nr:ECF transporter S component [Weissella fangxianensis]CCC57608.1 integral membrane protein [Weissella thailandensis fsh4-2]